MHRICNKKATGMCNYLYMHLFSFLLPGIHRVLGSLIIVLNGVLYIHIYIFVCLLYLHPIIVSNNFEIKNKTQPYIATTDAYNE